MIVIIFVNSNSYGVLAQSLPDSYDLSAPSSGALGDDTNMLEDIINRQKHIKESEEATTINGNDDFSDTADDDGGNGNIDDDRRLFYKDDTYTTKEKSVNLDRKGSNTKAYSGSVVRS
jgi:hypothetical protein